MSTEPTDEELNRVRTEAAQLYSASPYSTVVTCYMDGYFAARRTSAVTPEEVDLIRRAATEFDGVRSAVADDLRDLADRLEKGQSR